MSYTKIENSNELNRFIRTVGRSGKPISSIPYYQTIVPPDYAGRFTCTNYYRRKCRRNTNILPIIDLNGVGAGVDHVGSFVGGAAYAFLLPDATLTDEDDTEIGSIVVTFGGEWGADGDSESIRFGSFEIPSDADLTGVITVGSTNFLLEYLASGTLTITNNDDTTFPIEDGESIIQLFEYRNSSISPTVGDRTFSWVASDSAVSVEATLDDLDQPILDEDEEPIYA
jgi:hypothetical protein